MDALEAFDDDCLHAQQDGALGCPVAARARTVFLTGDDHQRCAVFLVLHRRVVDRHLLAIVGGDAAFDPGDHFVLDADVGEGAAHHHVVVAATRAVGVEVLLRDLVALEVGAGGAVFLDRTGGRNVVGGDRIAQDRQRLRIGDVGHRRGSHFHALEERRRGNVGAGRVPAIGVAGLDLDRLPVLVALVDIGITADEHVAVDVLGAVLAHLVIARPDVGQHHVLAVLILADRGFGDVLGHRALERIGDHQRRRGEEVGAHVR